MVCEIFRDSRHCKSSRLYTKKVKGENCFGRMDVCKNSGKWQKTILSCDCFGACE